MVSRDLASIIVCDAGPLMHLDELRCLDLLSPYEEVRVPERVWQEVLRHRPTALRRRVVSLDRVDVVPEAEPPLILIFTRFKLGAGERDALQLMQQFPEAKLLTDDAAARAAASLLGYTAQGTIGVIVQSVSLGLRTKRRALNTLRSIPRQSTLHVKRSFLNSVIAEFEESGP